MKIHLFDDYFLEGTENMDEYNAFLWKYGKEMYPHSIDVNYPVVLSGKEISDIKLLEQNMQKVYRLNFYILFKEEKIGWCFGLQTDHETFYMCNTAVFKQHHNKGIYKAILPVLLSILKEKGFQKVCSGHAATNNRVLIPKLKAGFIITGFEIRDDFGLQVKLTYYFNELRKQIIDYRIGELQPTAEIAKAVGLTIT